MYEINFCPFFFSLFFFVDVLLPLLRHVQKFLSAFGRMKQMKNTRKKWFNLRWITALLTVSTMTKLDEFMRDSTLENFQHFFLNFGFFVTIKTLWNWTETNFNLKFKLEFGNAMKWRWTFFSSISSKLRSIPCSVRWWRMYDDECVLRTNLPRTTGKTDVTILFWWYNFRIAIVCTGSELMIGDVVVCELWNRQWEVRISSVCLCASVCREWSV